MALAGMSEDGEGMFPNLDRMMQDGAPPPSNGGMFPRLYQPDQDMIRGMEQGQAAEAAGKIKSVMLEDVCLETFDLSDPADVKRYSNTYRTIFHGLEVGTHVLTFSDRQFVTEGGKPRWIHIMEYHVYKLEVRNLVEESTKRKAEADAAEKKAMDAWVRGPSVEDLGSVDDVRLQEQHGN